MQKLDIDQYYYPDSKDNSPMQLAKLQFSQIFYTSEFMQYTEGIIEDLVRATCKGNAEVRKRYLMRESLRNLVRLAKTEQLLEIRQNSVKLVPARARA